MSEGTTGDSSLMGQSDPQLRSVLKEGDGLYTIALQEFFRDDHRHAAAFERRLPFI